MISWKANNNDKHNDDDDDVTKNKGREHDDL